MRSHVTFKTPRFNQTEVQPHFINPCCFGEDCIFWLIAELRERGWADQQDGRRYLLSVGLIPEDEPEWLDHIQERPPLLDRLRGRGKLVVLPRLAPALHQVLRAAPDIRDVSWHFEDA